MDPKTQQPGSNVQQSVSQSVQQPVRQPVQNPQPIPTGRAKEMPPLGNEWVSPSTPEKIVLPKDVEKAGVEVQASVPTILPNAQQAGVAHAKEATPVQPVAIEPLGMQTQPNLLKHLKTVHKSWKDAMSWLVRLILKEQEKKESHSSGTGYN